MNKDERSKLAKAARLARRNGRHTFEEHLTDIPRSMGGTPKKAGRRFDPMTQPILTQEFARVSDILQRRIAPEGHQGQEYVTGGHSTRLHNCKTFYGSLAGEITLDIEMRL